MTLDWTPDVHNPHLNALFHIGIGITQLGPIDYEVYRWNGEALDALHNANLPYTFQEKAAKPL